MSESEKAEKGALEQSLRLEPEALAAVKAGLLAAEQDPRRWTEEQVKQDARQMAKQWQKALNQRESA